MGDAPVIVWVRRDFRLTDHPAFAAAAATGRPVIPLFVLDPLAEDLGAAPKWRLEQAIGTFAGRLEEMGSRLVLRRGDALAVLREVIAETGAGSVHWIRAYDPQAIARDTAVKEALTSDGLAVQSHNGHLLFEPWTVETGQGTPYRVYTPFWKAVRGRDPGPLLPTPDSLSAPGAWPESDRLEEWRLGAAMNRGAQVVARHTAPGEQAARDRLDRFLDEAVGEYREARDAVAVDGTSRLSDHLSLGEIGPRQCWHAGRRAIEEGEAGAETFLKELVWREFAYHLMYHTPRILSDNWREGWDAFPWSTDDESEAVRRWRQGRTGVPFVDAAMREMYVTGRMHNRARMIVASYLTKHLMVHWKIGQAWFDHCLTDWDPASNAMGWQWVAGSGPDASPFFRIFNPETQAEKFDPDGIYRRRWIAEGQADPPGTACSYFDAVPRGWGLSPDDAYPEPLVDLKDGRARALAAYEQREF